LKHSIQTRLLVTTTGVLVLFLTLTGWVLDRSYSASVVASAEEQLRLVIYSLMGSANERDGRLGFDQGLGEPRLSQPESGLYASINDERGALWVSPSAVTTSVSFPVVDNQPGLFVFSSSHTPVPRFHLSYMVIWEGVESEEVVFTATTDQLPFRTTIRQFRQSLGLGLGAATVFFIVAQLLALRWGLFPLRRMAGEVSELESGDRERLSERYPRELQGLAENLDRFVVHEQRSRSRYRNALEDLAHSLKTPLAVVRNTLLDKTPNHDLLAEQLDRMESTVTHQLSKASASGPAVVGRPVQLTELIERLLRALQTAYVDRGIGLEMQLGDGVEAKGDERDFLEVLGNVLENAFKYGNSKVRVAARRDRDTCLIVVEDDGAGIPEARRSEVLGRGKRLDEIQTGQGIGLAVVVELLALYGGDLEINDSELGGAAITVSLPVR